MKSGKVPDARTKLTEKGVFKIRVLDTKFSDGVIACESWGP